MMLAQDYLAAVEGGAAVLDYEAQGPSRVVLQHPCGNKCQKHHRTQPMTSRLIFVETRSNEKRATLCRQVEGFYEKGQHVLVVTDSTLAAQHLDQMLWTFSQESFVPHRIVTQPAMSHRSSP